jgi:hypothetical protein
MTNMPENVHSHADKPPPIRSEEDEAGFLPDDEKEEVHVTEMPEEKRILPY